MGINLSILKRSSQTKQLIGVWFGLCPAPKGGHAYRSTPLGVRNIYSKYGVTGERERIYSNLNLVNSH